MAPRPVWKGQIRLSLVSIPVEMYAATSSGSSISFRQIHRESGKRVHYEKVVPGLGPIDPADIVKGYEIGKDEYVLLTDDEIDDVKLETKKTLELIQFVDTCEIPPLYFDKPYYLVPQDELAEDAFRVVRDALRQASKTGLGQLSLRGKEYLVAIRPCGTGLLLETLHYEDEIRKSDSIFSDISADKAEEDLLAVASELIKRKTGPFDAAAFKDHYVDALKRLIAEKRKSGGTASVEEEEEETPRQQKGNIVDLMSSLKKSLESDRSDGASKKKEGANSESAKGAAAKRGSTSRKTSEKKQTEAKGGSSSSSRRRKSA
ncbi:Ku protein [Consotaella salsifontis]|uniref:Non-homologous end joining protein Ku n=1 Tax=Consotaella salsifontis TaxID=1365950 RepID=A0A1T4T6S3_9HYPH|nr:Ku protein [Consotaella salsifontis]SKA35931.1 DNA end-binding protein Ku [Consotaella salsifontis]